jgi:ribose 5-phosphate isomerase B
MKVAIASDHAGYREKEAIKQQLEQLGIAYHDFGTHSEDSVDYPDYAALVGESVARREVERGILVCGSGIGMAIAANKIVGVRAALVWSEETARLARQHNDANVVAVGARTTPRETINEIIRAFLDTGFDGGRHAQRVEKIGQLEQKPD